VDPVSRREFWRLLSEFLTQGITILIATPYLDEAERCSRVALMSDGGVLSLDSPGKLRQSFPDEVIEVIADPQEKATAILGQDERVRDVQTFGERLHVRVPRGRGHDLMSHAESVLPGAGVAIASMRIVPASLEDVFIDRVVSAKAGT
jgi:ABC-2 type transport system ATP-binding protein